MVFDREFSYQGFLESLNVEEIDIVIHLRLGSKALKFFNAEGREIQLFIAHNGKPNHSSIAISRRNPCQYLWYLGIRLQEAIMGMTSLSAENGYRIFQRQATSENSFRDLKTLLIIECR